MRKDDNNMKVYTIGFTQKSAQEFFELLKTNKIRLLVDIRLNNASQLAGFTKGNDLKYFVKQICNSEYLHLIELAPTKDILDGYKKGLIKWEEYERKYIELLNKRNIKDILRKALKDDFDHICLLCSEPTPEKCHRRLAAEYIKDKFSDKNIEVIHI
jgi:uncharacterized protein (DUF488 family)